MTDPSASGERVDAWYQRRGSGAILAGLVAVAALVVLTAGIGTPWPWEDEGATYLALQRSWTELAYLFHGPDAPIVPYYYLAKAWTAAVHLVWPGTSTVVAVRLLSAVAATATVVALYALVRRHAGLIAGVLAAGLLLSLPGFVRYAQEARAYALLACAATVSWLLCDRRLHPGPAGTPAVSRPRRVASGAVYVVSLTVTAVVNAFGVFQWPAHVVAAGLAPGSAAERRRRALAVAGLVAVAAVLSAGALLLSLRYGTGSLRVRAITPGWAVGQLTRAIAVSTQPWLVLPVLVLAVAGCVSRPRGGTVLPRSLLVWLAVPLTLELLAGVLRPALFRLRYWIAFLPPLAALAALGLIGLGTLATRMRAGGRPVIGVAALAASAALVVGQLALTVPAQLRIRTPTGHGRDLSTLTALLAEARLRSPDVLPVLTGRGTSTMLAAADPSTLAGNPWRELDRRGRIVYTVTTPPDELRRRLAGRRDLLWIHEGRVSADQAVHRMPPDLAALRPAVLWARTAGPSWTAVLLHTPG